MALLLPDSLALLALPGRAILLTPDGEIAALSPREAAERLREAPPLCVHAAASAKRLGLPRFALAYDLLELWAFVLPARGVAPTPRALARALDLDAPRSAEAEAALLPDIAAALLRRLAAGRNTPLQRDAPALATRMGRAGWPWAEAVLAALQAAPARGAGDALRVWTRLPEWEERPPRAEAASLPVAPAEARRRLAELLGPGAEQRASQADYASAAALAFAAREAEGAPHLVLAEAGTGTGKTLGYLAPASLWAERNGAPVWIATYTRNLQRQIEQEAARLFPEPSERRRRVVIRKGRENYLCLLNYEDAAKNPGMERVVPLGLVARWALATKDGDMQGGDFPGWLAELFPFGEVARLADRRGECLHGACRHHRRCFVEHSIRRAEQADLVVANHALVMVQAALGGGEDGRPTRYVFDEGHHVFDAADSAFSAALTGSEMAELRRWLLGAEGGRSRSRGLAPRLDEIIAAHAELSPQLDAALQAARALPGAGWWSRLAEAALLEGGAPNPAEAFCAAVRAQVLARVAEGGSAYGLECDLHPVSDALAEAGAALARALARIETPLRKLALRLAALPEEHAETMEPGMRLRIEGVLPGLERRALLPLAAWRAMLGVLGEAPPEPGERQAMVDWLALERRDGRDADAGMHRHHLDPTIPFAQHVAAPAHGMIVTSATLRDAGEPNEAAWQGAEARTGAVHLAAPAIRAALPSPFDYAARTRAFVVTDLSDNAAQIASAYRALFLAADGGALGLFTAISRLRETAERIAPVLAEAAIPLYAQHVDAMDNATLVDVFRAEERSCLLGTDAMRDGVDVPGDSLRLLVFDRVPWPRPTILHRERRVHLSNGAPGRYDDRVARHRLRQAFGRLIRRAEDRGVFVLLDRRAPSRLLAGLPVPVARVGLAEAVERTAEFLRA